MGSERWTGLWACPVDFWPGSQGAQSWTSPARIVRACPAASHPVSAPSYLYALSASRLDVKIRGEGDSLAHRVVQSVWLKGSCCLCWQQYSRAETHIQHLVGTGMAGETEEFICSRQCG